MFQPKIKSPWGRLLLKSPSPADDAAVVALCSDPETRRYVPPKLAKSILSVEDYARIRVLQAENPAFRKFHIFQLPDNERSGDSPLFIGTCQLKNIDTNTRSGEVGISLSSKVHRQGLGTEALYTLLSYVFDGPSTHTSDYPPLNLHRIYFITDLENVCMRGWFERFALRVEEELRDQDGWPDANVYAVLAGEEWMALKARLEERLTAKLGKPI